jgi:ketosteroid isomerase-like protein
MRLPIGLVILVAVTACLSPINRAPRSPIPQKSLEREIGAMDDSVSAAFNAHDADALMALFAPDLEFYHDTQGLQRYRDVSNGFRSLFASGNDIRRQRVGTLEVYPIRDFGAIEVGAHSFCHTEGGRPDCGTFKFVQVWRHEGSTWLIVRVVSYAH